MSLSQMLEHAAKEAFDARGALVVLFTPSGMVTRHGGMTPEMLALAGASITAQAVAYSFPHATEPPKTL